MTHLIECTCDACLLAQLTATEATQRRQGWETWYRRDAPVLYAYLARHCQLLYCPEQSEDLLHDCFLAAFRNVSRGRYTEQGISLCAYLHGIAKNLLRELVRLRRREVALPEQEEDSLPVSKAMSLDDQIHLGEVLTWVQAARERGSPLQQRVLAGLYTEDKSSHELARELNQTSDNTRAIASRAVHDIQEYLAHHYAVEVSSGAIRACLQVLAVSAE